MWLTQFRPTSPVIGIVAFLFASIVTFIGSVAVFFVWESGWVLLLLFASVFLYLSQRHSAKAVVVQSTFLLALIIFFAPGAYLLGLLMRPTDPDGGGLWIADFLHTLVIRWPVAAIIAGVVGGTGYLLGRSWKRSEADEQYQQED